MATFNFVRADDMTHMTEEEKKVPRYWSVRVLKPYISLFFIHGSAVGLRKYMLRAHPDVLNACFTPVECKKIDAEGNARKRKSTNTENETNPKRIKA